MDDPGDLDLYLALAARTGGPVLELGSGTGRLTTPLAEAGHHVTAVDNDPAMLDRARRVAAAADPETAARLEFVEGDLVSLRLPSAGTFRLAFIPLNTFLALGTREAQRAALRTLAVHLAPGGLAVVDAWQPNAEDLARFDGRLGLEYGRRDPESGRAVTKIASAQHDAARQAVTLTTIYEEGEPGGPVDRWLRIDRLRLVSGDELGGMAEDAGLEIERLAGGYDLEPIGPGSDRAVLVAIRR
ncbi:MAG: class I SAM-dependent methyltransferase [Chloroflexota bacterium]|nr:class I SAM-dependent methyltransferase [Chloroflexota bacterium]